MAKISVVVTIKNEVQSILPLVQALSEQTLLPDEVLIIDGGSTDGTVAVIEAVLAQYAKIGLQFIQEVGNRSKGRNVGFDRAQNEMIAVTDAGCVPVKEWLAALAACYDTERQVVAGYYRARHTSLFTEAVAPFFLVMPDALKEDEVFLPATRSVLLSKTVWKAAGGFDEKLSHNEDFAFFQAVLRHYGKSIFGFCKEAVVWWEPPQLLEETARKAFTFAVGDIQAGLMRVRVLFLVGRYLIFSLLVAILGMYFFGLVLLCYALAVVSKHRRSVKGRARLWLPIIQLTMDGAVLIGSMSGLWQYWPNQLHLV